MRKKLSIHPQIASIPFYPKAMVYGHDEGWVRLSSNENSFPPSEKVLQSLLDVLPYLNRYPGEEAALKSEIASNYGLSADQVVIGNGSNELIESVLRAMRDDGRKRVVTSDPAFPFYAIGAAIYGYETVKVPLRGMHVDLPALARAIDGGTRVVFLNNPLNPTGTIFTHDELLSFLGGLPDEVVVVVDEAYAEFAESDAFPRTVEMIGEYPIVVLRTFSKAYGLAGLRVGYGLAGAGIASFMERTKQPFSVNTMALSAARAALRDREYVRRITDHNLKAKRLLCAALDEAGVGYVPTEANYVLVSLGADAERIARRLFDRRIVVRWMGAYGLSGHIRVTLGRTAENELFLSTLKGILDEESPRRHH